MAIIPAPSLLVHADGSPLVDSSIYANTLTSIQFSSEGYPVLDTAVFRFGTGAITNGGNVVTDALYAIVTTGGILDVTTGDFTAECWIYFRSTTVADVPVFNWFTAAPVQSLQLTGSSNGAASTLSVTTVPVSSVVLTNTGSLVSNSWHHLAFVRQGNNFDYFVDGNPSKAISVSTASLATPYYMNVFGAQTPPSGGAANSPYANVDEFRLLKGYAAYTPGVAFTPPTAAFTPNAIYGSVNVSGHHGDITNPEAWIDATGNIPPLQFSQVPYNVNYPLNGDGRYWFQANANAPNLNAPITFIGDPKYLIDSANLQWSIVSTANDSSSLILAYSVTTGTWVITTISPQTQLGGIQNGQIPFSLTSVAQLQVQVYAQGGTALSTASLGQVAVAITRNYTEGLSWDGFTNPWDPVNYNALAIDNNIPTDTMSDLQSRILVRLGFANQASNPPPGMAALVQDFLTSAQKFLYKRYMQLHTKRFFRWKVNPGQRFYSLKDNDENVLEGVTMDPNKTIEWCGIQDSRNVWYPMIQGIPPQLYTMITKPWRPARYELRGAIEIYPVPDQTYWLWVRAHFGLMSFVNPSDTTTIDSELVFLWALANAKAHYGQPDAQNIAGQANAYKAELIAASHQTAHYLPGTIAVPPAVRPTLIQFDANSGGGS